jgi:hypothetical protein
LFFQLLSSFFHEVTMERRDFLKTAAAGAAFSGLGLSQAMAQEGQREFYELRIYDMQTGNRKSVLNNYLEKAAIPAWNRLGIKPVGIFGIVYGANALNLYVLIPHPSLDSFLSTPEKLASDAEYQKAAAEYLGTTIDNPAYTRYESTLLRAFPKVPKLRMPAETAGNKPRLFELRCYESHSEAVALKKIEMFCDGGEIALFDKIGIRSVFYGQTLIGRRQPNLVYMVVHQDMAARDKVWDDFGKSDEWNKMRNDPRYLNTVSATDVKFLRPAAYSQV